VSPSGSTLAPWLRRQLEQQGRIDPIRPGFHPDAQPGHCRGCQAPVIRAHDTANLADATADTQPLTAVGEAWALAAGRRTYRLGGIRRRYLERRDELHITEQPAHSPPDSQGPVIVLPAHECGIPTPTEFIDAEK
jgi:hypothetical protein